VSTKGPKPASAEHRFAELGIELTPAPIPFGAYVESVQTGSLLYLSGVLPVIGHEPKFVGRLGREYNVEQGREAARIAALNVLSATRDHLGSLDKVTRVVRLVAHIATEGDFLRAAAGGWRCLRAVARCLWRRQVASPDGPRRCEPSTRRASRVGGPFRS
jgi:enamine deaminase RidA (YjgF/YER057c/UK114 family)